MFQELKEMVLFFSFLLLLVSRTALLFFCLFQEPLFFSFLLLVSRTPCFKNSKKTKEMVLFFSSSACFKNRLFQEFKEMVLFFSSSASFVSRTAQKQGLPLFFCLFQEPLAACFKNRSKKWFFSSSASFVSRTAQRK